MQQVEGFNQNFQRLAGIQVGTFLNWNKPRSCDLKPSRANRVTSGEQHLPMQNDLSWPPGSLVTILQYHNNVAKQQILVFFLHATYESETLLEALTPK